MQISHRVLALLSSNDFTTPSASEGSFLEANLPRCRSRVLEDYGHHLLEDERLDLMAILEVCE